MHQFLKMYISQITAMLSFENTIVLSPGHVEEVYNIGDLFLLPYRNIYL